MSRIEDSQKDPVSKTKTPFSKPFFLGIGGSGMSSLAHILCGMGYSVSGYDGKKSDTIRILENEGIRIFTKATELPDNFDYDAAIYSSAIRLETHPIAKLFREKGIAFYHRSEVLHDIFSDTNSIAVAGSHGKTTTTAMVGYILHSAGMDPSIMVGGEVAYLKGLGGNFGKGSWSVFESDESDGTFLKHEAQVRVVTNIDDDHLDFYKTKDKLLEAFAEYISEARQKVVLNLDDIGIKECLTLVSSKVKIEGFFQVEKMEELNETSKISKEKQLSSLNLSAIPFLIFGGTLFFYYAGKSLQIRSKFPGDHYLKNSLAAVLAATQTGLSSDKAAAYVSEYTGVKRRLEYLGTKNGVEVYDDYGHHPTEVMAVLSSMSKLAGDHGRVVILFQPHRYTRTQNLYKEFAKVLDHAELVFLLPIYSAGEDPIEGVNSSLIADSMIRKPKILSSIQKESVSELRSELKPGDRLVSVGAGNVRDWALEYLS
ncbi:UDP-N-acetylmuramate--L-alanine ligase [Leptospira perolatii]|uniref:UDP-N-acetylmuramate--L-alanine ligase n=1 Tax=Leptospira perolatii TaxID=2023191 RepID=A0A2M9ZKD0_9LEPT|nr:UDP-N-acetylmuramate--L-alanine ligase [Leptospira perolatii]PJZ69397.1 UDP-N-acetylmuramate--L-alanine ligase [Leptospira perolatii]PJZ72532.1 UDP-N-acetylmuramate--L-alanine ligase [Leptospira perolatii]